MLSLSVSIKHAVNHHSSINRVMKHHINDCFKPWVYRVFSRSDNQSADRQSLMPLVGGFLHVFKILRISSCDLHMTMKTRK